MSIPNFLCIKWGKKYGSDYVNRLYRGVSKHMDGEFRFVCLTENTDGIDAGVEIYPLPVTSFDETAMDAKAGGGTWRKVGLFQPNLADLDGDTIFLDLDIVIMGKMDDLFAYNPGKFVVIQDWLEKRRAKFMPWRNGKVGNTSVFRFNPSHHKKVYEHFEKNQLWALDNFRIEQQYVSWAVGDDISFWKSEWVHSFKRSCRPVFPCNHFMTPPEPVGARVLVFHGHPLPSEAIAGYKGGLFKTTKPAVWINKYWN